MRYVVPGWSSGRSPSGLGVDLVDLGPRPERDRDQEDQPQQQQDPQPPQPRAAGARRPPEDPEPRAGGGGGGGRRDRAAGAATSRRARRRASRGSRRGAARCWGTVRVASSGRRPEPFVAVEPVVLGGPLRGDRRLPGDGRPWRRQYRAALASAAGTDGAVTQVPPGDVASADVERVVTASIADSARRTAVTGVTGDTCLTLLPSPSREAHHASSRPFLPPGRTGTDPAVRPPETAPRACGSAAPSR